MTKQTSIIGFILIAIAYVPNAQAQSKATNYVIEATIDEACSGSPGRIDRSAIIEADLTADVRRDLVVDHSGISCGNGMRSEFCGAAMCSVLFYVGQQNGTLKKVGEILSVGATLRRGKPPSVELVNRKGQASQIRWNGTSFR